MSKDQSTVSEFVWTVVSELSDTGIDTIRGTDRLQEDLGLDSLLSMELVSRVSEEFNIDPNMEQVMRVVTVDDVVATLHGSLKGAASGRVTG